MAAACAIVLTGAGRGRGSRRQRRYRANHAHYGRHLEYDDDRVINVDVHIHLDHHIDPDHRGAATRNRAADRSHRTDHDDRSDPPRASRGVDRQHLTLAGTTLIAGQPTPVILSVRNATDHPVSLFSAPDAMELGVSLAGYDISTVTSPDATSPVFSRPGAPTLAVGQERAFTMTITPPSEMVGAATMSADLLKFFMEVDPAVVYVFAGVPSIPIMVVPPGTSPGEPLDPALGKWKAALSADATEVAIGGSVMIHADVTNVGTEEQATRGYGSLVLACGESRDSIALEAQFAADATVAVGATQPLSLQLQGREFSTNSLICWVGLAFHPDPADIMPTHAVESDSVNITVLPSAPTTTSAPATTTTSTTP